MSAPNIWKNQEWFQKRQAWYRFNLEMNPFKLDNMEAFRQAHSCTVCDHEHTELQVQNPLSSVDLSLSWKWQKGNLKQLNICSSSRFLQQICIWYEMVSLPRNTQDSCPRRRMISLDCNTFLLSLPTATFTAPHFHGTFKLCTSPTVWSSDPSKAYYNSSGGWATSWEHSNWVSI